jgi:hypothetical protein
MDFVLNLIRPKSPGREKSPSDFSFEEEKKKACNILLSRQLERRRLLAEPGTFDIVVKDSIHNWMFSIPVLPTDSIHVVKLKMMKIRDKKIGDLELVQGQVLSNHETMQSLGVTSMRFFHATSCEPSNLRVPFDNIIEPDLMDVIPVYPLVDIILCYAVWQCGVLRMSDSNCLFCCEKYWVDVSMCPYPARAGLGCSSNRNLLKEAQWRDCMSATDWRVRYLLWFLCIYTTVWLNIPLFNYYHIYSSFASMSDNFIFIVFLFYFFICS